MLGGLVRIWWVCGDAEAGEGGKFLLPLVEGHEAGGSDFEGAGDMEDVERPASQMGGLAAKLFEMEHHRVSIYLGEVV